MALLVDIDCARVFGPIDLVLASHIPRARPTLKIQEPSREMQTEFWIRAREDENIATLPEVFLTLKAL